MLYLTTYHNHTRCVHILRYTGRVGAISEDGCVVIFIDHHDGHHSCTCLRLVVHHFLSQNLTDKGDQLIISNLPCKSVIITLCGILVYVIATRAWAILQCFTKLCLQRFDHTLRGRLPSKLSRQSFVKHCKCPMPSIKPSI